MRNNEPVIALMAKGMTRLNNNNDKSMMRNILKVIGGFAALITIIVFITGKEYLPEFFSKSSTINNTQQNPAISSSKNTEIVNQTSCPNNSQSNNITNNSDPVKFYLDNMFCNKHGTYICINQWINPQYDGPFGDRYGNIFERGIGMWSDNDAKSGKGYACYYLDKNYNYFEADLALEKRWINGDYGSTRFIVLCDNNEIFNEEFSNSSPTKHIKILLPKNTKVFEIEVEQFAGKAGTHGAIWGNAFLSQ